MFLYPECADTDKDKDEDEDEISGPFDRTNQLSKCVCVSGAGGRGGGEGEGFKAIPKDERQTFLDKHACRCVHNSVHVNTQFNTRFSRHACIVKERPWVITRLEDFYYKIVLVKNANIFFVFFFTTNFRS